MSLSPLRNANATSKPTALTSTPTVGVVVVASPFDWLFAKGTLASIRYFNPAAEICLLLDGDVDASTAERLGIRVIRKGDIPDPWMQAHSFGWGLTKMNAIWHARYPFVMHLDADTVWWGDLLSRLRVTEEDDVIWSVTHGEIGDHRQYVDTWFFNPELVVKVAPNFRWQEYVTRFSCTGTYVIRSGILETDRYRELIAAKESDPRLFQFGGEMGLLNLMVFEGYQDRKLQIRSADFQAIFPNHAIEELQGRFRFDEQGLPIVVPGDEQVLHMPDNKPLVDNLKCYSQPMTFFRLKYLEETEGITGAAAMERLRNEDAEYATLRKQFLAREKRGKILRLARGHRGEWSRLLGRFFDRFLPAREDSYAQA